MKCIKVDRQDYYNDMTKHSDDSQKYGRKHIYTIYINSSSNNSNPNSHPQDISIKIKRITFS